MSIRIRIAQWLAPEVFSSRESLAKEVSYWMDRSKTWSIRAMRRNNVLQAIAARRTPKANGTVRLICDLADAEINRKDNE